MTHFEISQARRDLAVMIAANDARKAENAAARKRAQGNRELCAELAADASRRGLPGIDWPEYFRNTDM
jgi:predicted solute-binding protein